MFAEYNSSSIIKSNQSIKNSKLILNNKDINRRFSNMRSIDITSRLGQFAWRQIIPSNILLPVIFRHHNKEEYLCFQMIKIHLLSQLSSEIILYWIENYPIRQFSLTIYEAELFNNINKFHSNGFLSNNNQLNYSKLDNISITPFIPFFKFYQFIYSNTLLNNSNQFYISSQLFSTFNKSNQDKEKEKEVVNNMYNSSKNILSKKSESNNSFCREINFHGKEILSYCTTSSIHLNERDNQTISCLSIKDIVSIYFPWSSIEQFIQICRKKQITRFKPDKSTDCDSTLRLVNIQELENHWNFILKELLPNTQTSFNKLNNQSEKDKLPVEFPKNNIEVSNNLSSNVNNEEQTNIVELPLKENFISNCSIDIENKNNNKDTQLNKSSQLNQQLNNENQLEINLLENKQQEDKQIEEQISSNNNHLSNKKLFKKNRRRRLNSYYTNKRRRKQKSKNYFNKKSLLNNYDEQYWMKKYSIESFSIVLNRYQLNEH